MADRSDYALGIDLGTTSVKACILNLGNKSVVAQQKKDTQATVFSDQNPSANKQDVSKIVSALQLCLSRLPREALHLVTYIGVSGQMHGMMMWKGGSGWERKQTERYEVKQVSRIYTWQDRRCSQAFLNGLPTPDSHLRVHPGYGCATLFWLKRFKPYKMQQFDRVGTVQDFVVAMICELNEPVMSKHNAASWGYFNTETGDWNVNILRKAKFPCNLLPKVAEAGSIAGKLAQSWYGIPEGTAVGVGLGDCQCSVRSIIGNQEAAVLNISTSAQLAFVMPDDFVPPKITEQEGSPSPMEYFPYFDGRYIAVVASMNGGNSLAAFVRMVQQWCMELGFSIPQDKIWKHLMAVGRDETSLSALEIVPTLFSERHAIYNGAAVTNIGTGNTSLGKVFRALCGGVVDNLRSMMPRSVLEVAHIKKILGCGSALLRNPVLQEQVVDMYGLPVEFEEGGDSAIGAAKSVFHAVG